MPEPTLSLPCLRTAKSRSRLYLSIQYEQKKYTAATTNLTERRERSRSRNQLLEGKRMPYALCCCAFRRAICGNKSCYSTVLVSNRGNSVASGSECSR